jgi:hypothetical protein
MAERFEEGAEAPPGVYRCTVCGERIVLKVARTLPLCVTCFNGWWESVEEHSGT